MPKKKNLQGNSHVGEDVRIAVQVAIKNFLASESTGNIITLDFNNNILRDFWRYK